MRDLLWWGLIPGAAFAALSLLIWTVRVLPLRRDGYWREFNARRRGSQGRNIQRGRNP